MWLDRAAQPFALDQAIYRLVDVCKYLAEENETLKADVKALQNARKGAGWS